MPVPVLVPAAAPSALDFAGQAHEGGESQVSSSLYCLFSVSLLYFWLSLFALRQAVSTLGLCQSKRRARLGADHLYTPFHFGTFAHATIRWVLLVLAYFTDLESPSSPTALSPSSSPALAVSTPPLCDSRCELRRAVLGDLPGFIFIVVYLWLFIHILQNTAAAVERGRQGGSEHVYGAIQPDAAARSIPSRRRRRGAALCATFSRGCISSLRILFVGLFFGVVLVWLVLVVFLSSPTENDASTPMVETARDSIFLGLFVSLFTLCAASLYQLSRTTQSMNSIMVRMLRLDHSSLRCLLITGAVAFLLRAAAVASVFGNAGSAAAGRPVLILPNMSLSTLLFNAMYYILSEIACSLTVVYLLRNRLFGDDHNPLLERVLLPDDLEVSPSQVACERAIGAGGFGVVYRGYFRGALVAIKKLHPTHISKAHDSRGVGGKEVQGDDEDGRRLLQRRQRFVQEAKILCKLRHPRIVQLIGYTYFDADSSFALIMEYMAGGSLFDILHQRSGKLLTLRQTLIIGSQMAEGLAFLHASGVTHRDFKSANVLCDEHMLPKICDFGLSKQALASAAEFATSAPSTHGTIAWSAPELLTGRGGTTAVDTYSWAIVFWELLSRNIPYQDIAMAAAILGVLGPAHMRPSVAGLPILDAPNQMPDTLAQPLLRLVQAAWAHEPSMRPSMSKIRTSLLSSAATLPAHMLDAVVLQAPTADAGAPGGGFEA